MFIRGQQYYFGSYGLVRGYGPLFRTLEEADFSVREDSKAQRKNGGSTDRNAVMVSRFTGLCWWADEYDPRVEVLENSLLPVRTADSQQARYPLETIKGYEEVWGGPPELAGFA